MENYEQKLLDSVMELLERFYEASWLLKMQHFRFTMVFLENLQKFLSVNKLWIVRYDSQQLRLAIKLIFWSFKFLKKFLDFGKI